MTDIDINRRWAMPNSETFRIKPIRELLDRYIRDGERWVDPFARESVFSDRCLTNDMNPNCAADYNMEALEFLRTIGDGFDGVLFDPPYSPRQIKECYEGIGLQCTAEETKASWWSDRKDAAASVLRVGGLAISFGWNSGGLGKCRGMRIIEILMVPHGGMHHDTIVTVEVKADA